ncbi:hypothetical protein KKG05_07075 [bacterium]|nr:hypothetical protein [bacterium]
MSARAVKRSMLYVLFLFAANVCLSATLETKLEPASARIGDLLQLKVTIKDGAGAKIEWPHFLSDSLAFQLISIDSSGMLPQERIFNLALYDTGTYLLPPLPVILHSANSRETLFTKHTQVEIVSVLPDTASVPQPIKAPRSLPWTIRDMLAWAPWLVGLLLIAAAIYFYRKYQKQKQPEKYQAPEIILPAHELALRELIALRDRKYPERGMLREFYTEISEILRRYMERRYEFPALEMTTWDLEHELSRERYPQILMYQGLPILRESDLVKFAKYLPEWQNCAEHLESAFKIVQATKESDEAQAMGVAA